MKQYKNLIKKILTTGERKTDRTGTGTISIFSEQLKFDDIATQFPLVTLKSTHFRSIMHELIWMMSGSTNIAYLKSHNVRIWDEWANADGELGPVYGSQWRNWVGLDRVRTDQLDELVRSLAINKDSRRHILSAWNVGQVKKMALPPCHMMAQFYVSSSYPDNPRRSQAEAREDKRQNFIPCESDKIRLTPILHCHMYQRSADCFLGLPFNIASYALLTNILAKYLSYNPGTLTISLGDAHLYTDHIPLAKKMIKRTCLPLPSLTIVDPISPLEPLYPSSNIVLSNYLPHALIPGKVSV